MDGWTKVMNLFMDMYSPGFVEGYYIIVVIICSFFVLNLTIAIMLLKYDEVNKEHEESSLEGNPFNDELTKYAETIFQPEHHAIIQFIIENDGIQLDPSAQKYLKAEKGFFAALFSAKEFDLDRYDSYYQKFLPKLCLEIISHPLFDGSIMCVILLNTIILSLDQYPELPKLALQNISALNMGFTLIFTFDCVTKMIGLGWSEYTKEGFNNFDLFIVCISWFQIILAVIGGKQKGGGIFLVLRTFRVFRIFKLFKIGTLKMLLDSITFTMSTIGPYVMFLSFFIYIFALIGMSFFANKIRFNDDDQFDLENGELPRENFDSLGDSVITIFQLIMGGWSDIMFDYMRSVGSMASIYFVFVKIFGGIVLINLFLAIMLGNFDKAKFYGQKKNLLQVFEELMVNQKIRNYTIIEAVDITMGDIKDYIVKDVLHLRRPKVNPFSKLKKKKSIADAEKVEELEPEIEVGNSTTRDLAPLNFKPDERVARQNQDDEDDFIDDESTLSSYFEVESAIHYCSLLVFHIDLPFRKWCLEVAEPKEIVKKLYHHREHNQLGKPLLDNNESSDEEEKEVDPDDSDDQRVKQIDKHKVFDNLILVLIIISSLMLPLDNPLNDPNAGSTKFIMYINVIFTLIFTFEASVKIIGKGLMFNKLGQIEPYFADSWNKVDGFVVTISVLDLILMITGGGSNFAALKALRALRALRPLRLIKRFENLRVVVNALFSTFNAIQNILMVGSILLLIFAIMGVSFFKGKFFYCSELSDDQLDEVITKQDCIDKGGEWLNTKSNFDNVGVAFLTLFQMMTGEGWVEMMYAGMDITGIDMQPKRNASSSLAIYFIAYMIVGSLFVMNLFVGVVIENFNKIKEKQEMGSAFVTDTQKEWIVYQKIGQKITFKKKPKQPQGIRKFFNEFAHSKKFGDFISLMVLLNTIVMASNFYQMPELLKLTFKRANLIFSIIFNLEMIFKLIALHERYFLDSWNLFDMFIVITADIGIILDFLEFKKGMSAAITILRALRLLRIVKLLKKFQSIKVIVDAVINILPNISNVMSLFALALFIFACVGINLFAIAKPIGEINEKNNFQTFGNAMVILFRFSTGESWSVAMNDLANKEDCKASQTYDEMQETGIQGCGTSISYFFFYGFQIVVVMLILNLAIAAVIDGLSEAQNDADRLFQLSNIEEFNDLWSEYDPKGTGKITIHQLPFFLVEIGEPWSSISHLKRFFIGNRVRGFLHYEERGMSLNAVLMMREMLNYKIKSFQGQDGIYRINFGDLYKKLIKLSMKRNSMDKFKLQSKKMTAKLKKGWTNEKKGTFDTKEITALNIAAMVIGQQYRIKKKNDRRKERELREKQLAEQRAIREIKKAQHKIGHGVKMQVNRDESLPQILQEEDEESPQKSKEIVLKDYSQITTEPPQIVSDEKQLHTYRDSEDQNMKFEVEYDPIQKHPTSLNIQQNQSMAVDEEIMQSNMDKKQQEEQFQQMIQTKTQFKEKVQSLKNSTSEHKMTNENSFSEPSKVVPMHTELPSSRLISPSRQFQTIRKSRKDRQSESRKRQSPVRIESRKHSAIRNAPKNETRSFRKTVPKLNLKNFKPYNYDERQGSSLSKMEYRVDESDEDMISNIHDKPVLGFQKGLATEIKYLLSHLGIKYETIEYDKFYNKASWKIKRQPNSSEIPKLPYFVDGDCRIEESIAIQKYIAGKWGQHLIGKDFVERAKINMISTKINEIKMVTLSSDNDDLIDLIFDKIPGILTYLGKQDFLMGNDVTWIDFSFAEICEFLQNQTQGELFKHFPQLSRYLKNVMSVIY